MHSLNTPDFENKRKHTRFVRDDIKASITQSKLFGVSEKVACKLIDISSAGVQISTKENLTIKSNTNLILNFDNGHQFQIKTTIIRHHKITHYLTDHLFMLSNDFLDNKDNPLKSISLFDKQQEIIAKFRFLNPNCLQVMSSEALNTKKQYHIIFTLNSGKSIKVASKINRQKRHQTYSYGLKFKKVNDQLGDHLLTTQTDLIFK